MKRPTEILTFVKGTPKDTIGRILSDYILYLEGKLRKVQEQKRRKK